MIIKTTGEMNLERTCKLAGIKEYTYKKKNSWLNVRIYLWAGPVAQAVRALCS